MASQKYGFDLDRNHKIHAMEWGIEPQQKYPIKTTAPSQPSKL